MANYDHPSYITRQSIVLGATTAGANGTSCQIAFPNDMLVHKVTATVKTAGTSATTGNAAILQYIGTSVLGGTSTTTTTFALATLALTSSVANTVVTSADCNCTLKQGGVLSVKNGTDATGVCSVSIEATVDPMGSFT